MRLRIFLLICSVVHIPAVFATKIESFTLTAAKIEGAPPYFSFAGKSEILKGGILLSPTDNSYLLFSQFSENPCSEFEPRLEGGCTAYSLRVEKNEMRLFPPAAYKNLDSLPFFAALKSNLFGYYVSSKLRDNPSKITFIEDQAIMLNLDMDSKGKGALEKYNRLFDEINKIENASFPEETKFYLTHEVGSAFFVIIYPDADPQKLHVIIMRLKKKIWKKMVSLN